MNPEIRHVSTDSLLQIDTPCAAETVENSPLDDVETVSLDKSDSEHETRPPTNRRSLNDTSEPLTKEYEHDNDPVGPNETFPITLRFPSIVSSPVSNKVPE
jgi:hypothetical protein